MVKIVLVNADHRRDFHPLADHRVMTHLRTFTEGELFSAFPFSIQLMFDQTVI